MICETQPYIATWCPVCDKRLSDKERDTYGLLKHIRKSHPKQCKQYLCQEEEPRKTSKQIVSMYSQKKECSSRKNEPRKVYATRVDTWKSHNEKKVCPRCRREAVPTLHARGDKLTTSHIGALCLLGCWPLCFVPLMMKRAKKFRMICPLCGYMYGSFQYKNTGLAPCKADSEDSQTRLSSPPSFRLYVRRQDCKN
ncbi:PREDICTED: uncharacterized protein LOC108576093 [Habropoda laboriosa]|uniref:uncharacterized protein LOC108576093 n=1 Tax=Habropoda laboriosa TaxID=597456 RepID=UPI00083D4963|nr:PREDICTED: uncharacterized protein LOC108576093 [Habropoda laboriosa]